MSSESTKSVEVWKDVPGYPGYQSSSHGNVRTKWHNRGYVQGIEGKAPTTLTKVWRIVNQYTHPTSGYLHVCIPKVVFGSQKNVKVSKLVCLAFHGSRPTGAHQVAHFPDRSKTNNSSKNLRWATGKENAEDRVAHGTSPVGELNPRCKLSESSVLKIRELRSGGMSTPKIHKLYPLVSKSTIEYICAGKTWKHLIKG